MLGVPLILCGLYLNTAEARWFSLVFFLAAAGTDWLDGYLARRLNQVTDLGKFLDPLVDKLLVLAPLLVLIELGQVPAWGVFLILMRELAISGWRVNQAKIIGANFWGKLKTVSQILAVSLLSLLYPLPIILLHLQSFGVALTLISGGIYLWPHTPSSRPYRG